VRKKKAAPVAEAQGTQVAAAPRKRARKSKGTGEEQVRNEAAGGGEEGRQTQTPVRHRSATPDDAEAIEVDIRQVKMGDLIKDMRIGKKFSRHDELLERERMKRQKNYMAKKLKGTGLDSLANSNDGSRASSNAATPAPDQGEAPPTPREDQPAATVVAPQFQIINGQIVLNSNSLQFDRHAHAAERAGEMEEEIEDEFTHHTTSSTYMKRQTKSNNWTPVETEKFYHALGMFGTDFQIISRMFPDKTRRHIKLKFNREERLHPQRVNAALVGTKTVAMDMDEYKSHTGQEYETVDAITAEHRRAEEEFEAEQRRIDEAAANEAKRKRDELYGERGDDEDSDDGAATKRVKGRGRSKKPPLAGLRA
jgi:transcription factor TFIIIB component B''